MESDPCGKSIERRREGSVEMDQQGFFYPEDGGNMFL
jgi:hypothetical protein